MAIYNPLATDAISRWQDFGVLKRFSERLEAESKQSVVSWICRGRQDVPVRGGSTTMSKGQEKQRGRVCLHRIINLIVACMDVIVVSFDGLESRFVGVLLHSLVGIGVDQGLTNTAVKMRVLAVLNEPFPV